jgi:hypothetical protein
MNNEELKDIFLKLFDVDITDKKFRKFEFTKNFAKVIGKIKGQDLINILSKIFCFWSSFITC